MKDGTNIFQFVRSNPICYKDPDGRFIPVVIFGVYIAAEVVAAAALTVSAMAVVAIHNAQPALQRAASSAGEAIEERWDVAKDKTKRGWDFAKEKAKEGYNYLRGKVSEWGKAKPAEPEAIPKPGTPDTPVPDAPPETTPAEPESPPQEAEPQEQPAEPEEEPPEQTPDNPKFKPKPWREIKNPKTLEKWKGVLSKLLDWTVDKFEQMLRDMAADQLADRRGVAEWHHVFPQEFRSAFEQVGVDLDIDAAQNGRYVDPDRHRAFSWIYSLLWEAFLQPDRITGKTNRSREEIKHFGKLMTHVFNTFVVARERFPGHPIPNRPGLTP
ncbi:hypothetical protein B0O99DRAFT_632797 [Bisporella sp. PMI_857]|nr:hypothetical protein B0O99DRAFT_632797 [Bisporella sp. PMI_857]